MSCLALLFCFPQQCFASITSFSHIRQPLFQNFFNFFLQNPLLPLFYGHFSIIFFSFLIVPILVITIAASYIFKLATPISNGGLLLYPPGIITGSAKGGISQYHFYWLPSKEGSRYFLPSSSLSFSSCS